MLRPFNPGPRYKKPESSLVRSIMQSLYNCSDDLLPVSKKRKLVAENVFLNSPTKTVTPTQITQEYSLLRDILHDADVFMEQVSNLERNDTMHAVIAAVSGAGESSFSTVSESNQIRRSVSKVSQKDNTVFFVMFQTPPVFFITCSLSKNPAPKVTAVLEGIMRILVCKSPVIAPSLQRTITLLGKLCSVARDPQNTLDPYVGAWLTNPDKDPYERPFAQLGGEEVKFCTQVSDADFKSIGPHRSTCRNILISASVADNVAERLEQAGMYTLYVSFEMKVAVLLARMQLSGLPFAPEPLEKVKSQILGYTQALEEKANSLAGREVCIRSAQQVESVLFDTLGLPQAGSKRAGKVNVHGMTTKKTVLIELSRYHEFPRTVLLYRKAYKLLSTYILPLLAWAEPGDDGSLRLFPSWLGTAVGTGRLASARPNAQNLPARPVDDPDSRGQMPSINVRNAIRAGNGFCLVSGDYCQIEIRVMAHMSQDQVLLRGLQSGGDIFRQLAAIIYSSDKVTDVQRSEAKRCCFSILYGTGIHALAAQLHKSVTDAQLIVNRFKARFPVLLSFLASIVEKCRKEGYVQTLFGRRRYLPAIRSSNWTEQKYAERQAVNTVIQGTAADICKLAMINLDQESRRSPELRDKFTVICQIHDELLLEVRKEDVDQIATCVKNVMTNVVCLDCDLKM